MVMYILCMYHLMNKICDLLFDLGFPEGRIWEITLDVWKNLGFWTFKQMLRPWETMGNFDSEPNVISIMIQKQAYVLAFRLTRPTLETNRVHQAYAYASPGLRQYWFRHCLQLHPYNYANFKKAEPCCSLSSSSSLPPVSLFLCLCLFLHSPLSPSLPAHLPALPFPTSPHACRK